MALFPWKKKDETAPSSPTGTGGTAGGTAGGSGGAEGGIEFSPEKASRFFERAAALHEATNYGYAMNLWLRGLRFDPTAMNGLEGFFKSSASFFTENPKGVKDENFKATAKDVSGRTPVDRFLSSLLDWSAHPLDPAYAVKAMEGAAELGLPAPAIWIADRAVGATLRDKKPRKEHLVVAMNVYKRFDRVDKAVEVGEAAMRVDPNDARLQSEVRNMAAESTMTKGGFDQAGEQGGFRANIRDADKQRRLDEAERLVTTEEVLDRQVAAARAEAEAQPADRPTAIRLIDTLLKRARPEDEDEAVRVADRWYAQTKEYRFREYADTVRTRQLRKKAARLKAQAEQPGATDEMRDAAKAALREFVLAEIAAYEGQVAAYPTDLGRKFELAKRLYQVKRYDDAIGLLQEAKADVKNRASVLFYLGLSFQQMGWNDEAIETIRQALAQVDQADEKITTELKYGLMEALLARAGAEGALADAEGAYKLASEIAIQNINFKQIRARREEIKALVTRLRAGGGGGAAPGPSPAPATA